MDSAQVLTAPRQRHESTAMRFLKAIPILAFSLLLLQSIRAESTPPNIVIFLADDMGAGDTSAYQDWAGNSDQQYLKQHEI